MAVVGKFYNKAPANMLGGETAGETNTLDWASDTVVALLLTNAYTPNRNTHEFISDVVASEATGVTNYSRKTLATTPPTFDSGTRQNRFDHADVVWLNLTGSFKYVTFAKNTGSDATSQLICYVDLDDTSGTADVDAASQNFTFIPSATGLFTLTPEA